MKGQEKELYVILVKGGTRAKDIPVKFHLWFDNSMGILAKNYFDEGKKVFKSATVFFFL